ncbi:MAG: pyridoxamine 5'-phosphate oxidase family protein [Candidatus Heimdallarchaeota archaeon]
MPVLFAYKKNQIYIHSAPEGRKIKILKSYPRICFEVSEFLGYNPIKQFTSYRSVLCFGNVYFLTTNDKPAYLEALELITQKYNPGGELQCTEGALVLRLDVDVMTGRERVPER